MSEEERDQNETPPEEPGTGDPPEPDTDDGGDLQAELARWKREKRKWEDRAKENAEKARQFDEYQESQKSEQERLAEARAEAERKAQEAQREVALMRVAIRKGLTEEQMEWLQGKGETEDELEAAADKFLALIKPSEDEEPTATDVPRRPQERLRSGSSPTVEPEETDPRKLASSLPRM